MDTVDEIDRRIIDALKDDGRLSVSALASVVNISRANAYTRLNRLLEQKIITGFTAKVEPDTLGTMSAAFVMIRTEQASWQQVRDGIMEIPEVKHISLVTGDFDVMLLVRARDNADLRRVVLNELRMIPYIRDTKTSIIFEETKRE